MSGAALSAAWSATVGRLAVCGSVTWVCGVAVWAKAAELYNPAKAVAQNNATRFLFCRDECEAILLSLDRRRVVDQCVDILGNHGAARRCASVSHIPSN